MLRTGRCSVDSAKERSLLRVTIVKFPGLGHGLQPPDLAGTSQGKNIYY